MISAYAESAFSMTGIENNSFLPSAIAAGTLDLEFLYSALSNTLETTGIYPVACAQVN